MEWTGKCNGHLARKYFCGRGKILINIYLLNILISCQSQCQCRWFHIFLLTTKDYVCVQFLEEWKLPFFGLLGLGVEGWGMTIIILILLPRINVLWRLSSSGKIILAATSPSGGWRLLKETKTETEGRSVRNELNAMETHIRLNGAQIVSGIPPAKRWNCIIKIKLRNGKSFQHKSQVIQFLFRFCTTIENNLNKLSSEFISIPHCCCFRLIPLRLPTHSLTNWLADWLSDCAVGATILPCHREYHPMEG